MTVYVLGAGASVHAGYPLASDLFSRLREWASEYYSTGEGSKNHFAKKFVTDLDLISSKQDSTEALEDILAALQDKALARISPVFFDYFKNHRTSDGHLYRRLAVERVQPGDSIITLNYDLAVERALRQAELWDIRDGYGFHISALPDPIEQSRVQVLKLHGSANWAGREFRIGPRPLVPFRPDYEYLGYNSVLDDQAPDKPTPYRFVTIPPIRHKEFNIETPFGRRWVEFWDFLFGLAEKALQSAERVVLIGYSLPKADERARELILDKTNKDALITIVCRNDTRDIAGQKLT